MSEFSEWKPFMYIDAYIKSSPENIACDYREVTHKIPAVHTMIDPRTQKEVKGVFIPAGDIQLECWYNPVDPSSPNYQDWHKDSMHIKIMEVDSYNRNYCDQQKKKNYEDKKPDKEIGYGFQKETKPKNNGQWNTPQQTDRETGGSSAPLNHTSTGSAAEVNERIDDDIPF